MILAVFFFNIPDNFLAPIVLEIQINIGKHFPLGIQKTLKNNVMTNRIDIGNAQRIRHD